MTNREKAIETLRNAYARRISFSFDIPETGVTVTVNGGTFARVARAIEDGRITVKTRASGRGIGGIYDSKNNVLYIPEIIGRRERVMVIHESVHASFDLVDISRSRVPPAYNEAAAYIASSLYALYTGMPPAQRGGRRPHTSEIYAVSETIARSIHAGNGVNPDALNRLKRLIESHPINRTVDPNYYDGSG